MFSIFIPELVVDDDAVRDDPLLVRLVVEDALWRQDHDLWQNRRPRRRSKRCIWLAEGEQLDERRREIGRLASLVVLR